VKREDRVHQEGEMNGVNAKREKRTVKAESGSTEI